MITSPAIFLQCLILTLFNMSAETGESIPVWVVLVSHVRRMLFRFVEGVTFFSQLLCVGINREKPVRKGEPNLVLNESEYILAVLFKIHV